MLVCMALFKKYDKISLIAKEIETYGVWLNGSSAGVGRATVCDSGKVGLLDVTKICDGQRYVTAMELWRLCMRQIN